MMNVFSGTWANMFRQGMVIVGVMAMANALLHTVALAEEASGKEQAPHVMLKTKFGEMEIVLFQDLAPKHVESFLKLAEKGIL